jgi:hypothetical protein
VSACGRLALACGLGALASCQATPGPATPELYTTASLAALLATSDPSGSVAQDAGVPGGIPLRRIIADDGTGKPTLVPRATFSDGYRSAYLTTEVWTHFDEVWAQPMYVAVSGYDVDGTPKTLVGAAGAWRPIFGVGSDSKFYSPYWQVTYFEIPPGADVDSFRSVRDVIDRGLDLNAAGERLAVLAPDSVGIPARVASTTDGSLPIGGPTPATGLLDGQEVPFLDFGAGTFTWNDDLVVEEAPIFVWVARDASGALQTLDIPTVAGTGPLYSNRPAKVVDHKPLYGSYWRLYTVEVPAAAGVFAPTEAADLRAALAARPDLYTADYNSKNTALPASALPEWEGRVTLNPGCFADYLNLDPTNGTSDECQYLDSQAAIEANVPSGSIERTDILVTCPFVTYEGVPVLLP